MLQSVLNFPSKPGFGDAGVSASLDAPGTAAAVQAQTRRSEERRWKFATALAKRANVPWRGQINGGWRGTFWMMWLEGMVGADWWCWGWWWPQMFVSMPCYGINAVFWSLWFLKDCMGWSITSWSTGKLISRRQVYILYFLFCFCTCFEYIYIYTEGGFVLLILPVANWN